MKLECRRRISPTPLDMRGIFSSFPSFSKSRGAGVTGIPPVRLSTITSALFIPLLTATPALPAPGKLTIRSHVE